MTSQARKRQLAWQARHGTTQETRRAATEELRRIGEHERRLRSDAR